MNKGIYFISLARTLIKENFKVNYLNSESGWINFEVVHDKKKWQINASHFHDPFGDLISWLEQIIDGDESSSFSINEEGSEVILSQLRINDKICYFKIECKDIFDKMHFLMNLEMDTCTLIKEFYEGLIHFALSDNYKKQEWRNETLEERFMRILHIKNPKTLVDFLLQFTSNELEAIFYKVSSLISDQNLKNKNELLEFINLVKKVGFLNYDSIRFNCYYDYSIHEGYKVSSTDIKKQILMGILKENTSGYDGTDLIKRKSSKIDKWLSDPGNCI